MPLNHRMIVGRRRFIFVIAWSAGAWIVGLLLSLVFAALIPEEYVPEPSQKILELREHYREHGSFSNEDIERTRREFEQMQRDLQARIAARKPIEQFRDIQRHALAVNWIPWALLGLLMLGGYGEMIAVIAFLAAVVALGALPIINAALCIAAVIVSLFLKRMIKRVHS